MRKTNIYSFPDPKHDGGCSELMVENTPKPYRNRKRYLIFRPYLIIVCSQRSHARPRTEKSILLLVTFFSRVGGKSLETSKNGELMKNSNPPLRLLLHWWVQKRLETFVGNNDGERNRTTLS